MPFVLVHLESSLNLPAKRAPHVRIAVYGDGEATLAVNEPHDPHRIELKSRHQSFLLIVPTGRIVTAHRFTLRRG